MSAFSLLVPVLHGGATLQKTIDSLMAQSMGDFEVQLCTNGESCELPDDVDPRLQVERGEFRNLASMKYFVFREASAQVIAEIPEGVVLHPEALERVWLAFRQKAERGVIFSSFQEDTTLVQTSLFPGDLTERVNLGPLLFYRHAAVNKAGGWDPSFHTAHEYDLRLRMTGTCEFHHISMPLCTIFPRKDEKVEAKQLGASKVFSPGEGPQGGFSYLFYGPSEEMEFETAFKNHLHREGAFLSNPPKTVEPRGDAEVEVSVVIPVYNRERFIGRAIESVMEGNFQDFEIICVDNGSSDGTCAVIEEWAKRDDRVRLFKNDQNNIARALNLGHREARGRYFAQLDSDDEYTPRTLEAAVEAFEAHECWALAVSWYELMEEDGSPIPEMGIIKHLEYDPNNHLRVDGAGAVRVWHHSVIKELGGFDEERYGHFAEDYDLVARLAEQYDVGRLHEVLYRYRRHPDNTDVKRSPEMKISNKTQIRHEAIARRRQLNQG